MLNRLSHPSTPLPVFITWVINAAQRNLIFLEYSSTVSQPLVLKYMSGPIAAVQTLFPLPESSPGVTDVTIIEKPPAERHMISSWEQVSVALFNPYIPTKRGQLQ